MAFTSSKWQEQVIEWDEWHVPCYDVNQTNLKSYPTCKWKMVTRDFFNSKIHTFLCPHNFSLFIFFSTSTLISTTSTINIIFLCIMYVPADENHLSETACDHLFYIAILIKFKTGPKNVKSTDKSMTLLPLRIEYLHPHNWGHSGLSARRNGPLSCVLGTMWSLDYKFWI